LETHLRTRPLPPTLRNLPLRKRVRYNPGMTIAAAFRCADGVLLGADTLITDGYTKTHERKIFPCSRFGWYPSVQMTGAGSLPRIKSFAAKLNDDDAFGDASSCGDIQAAIDTAVKSDWYQDAVSKTNAEHENMECLFAVKDDSGKTALLHLYNSTLYPIDYWQCIGTGGPVMKYLCSWLYSPTLPISISVVLMSYMFQEAKDHGDGCGGDTNIVQLFDGLRDEYPGDVFVAEPHAIRKLYQAVSPVLRACANKELPEEIFESHLNRLTLELRGLRAAVRG
jgi:20S proteasome alpha/beta subunit